MKKEFKIGELVIWDGEKGGHSWCDERTICEVIKIEKDRMRLKIILYKEAYTQYRQDLYERDVANYIIKQHDFNYFMSECKNYREPTGKEIAEYNKTTGELLKKYGYN